jgi:hypothetical protein
MRNLFYAIAGFLSMAWQLPKVLWEELVEEGKKLFKKP